MKNNNNYFANTLIYLLNSFFKRTIFFWIIIFTCSPMQAQIADTIEIHSIKNNYLQGDSIHFEVNLKNYNATHKLATIQLWVEELKTGKKWKFRYPLIKGYLNATIKVDNKLKDGAYAFNFLLQNMFFDLKGKVNNLSKNDKVINYVMISKNKQTLADNITLDNDQQFLMHHLLFEDSAFIIFSKPKQRQNDLLIKISTPLDSAFTPSATVTKFISIGKIDSSLKTKSKVPSNYAFASDDEKYKNILPEVVVKSISHKKLEDFDNENTTGMFTGSDAIFLDGLGTDEIANAPDLYTYLIIKVGGLKLETDNLSGNRFFTWRGQPTDIYINEIKLDQDLPLTINAADIAMIKIFRPGVSISAGSGQGGAIAIYTKTEPYQQSIDRKYCFYIVGYTGLESTWR